jgi:zinc protease
VAEVPAAPVPPSTVPRPPVRVSTLSNGLRLLCRTNDASDIVSVVCLVQAGLPDEGDEQSGLAALTAEALVKGTSTHPGSSFGNAVANAGGSLRAAPGFDFTEISVVASREQFELALKLIADVVAHPSFDDAAVDEARATLKRRATALQDDFTASSYQNLVGQMYGSGPYGRPINGYEQTLDRLKAADVQRFWKRCYVQNRMVVAVVGDVDSTRALTLAQNAFSDVPFEPGATTRPPDVAALARSKVDFMQRGGPAAQVMIGFLAPAATRATYPLDSLVDAIVGGGKRARLFTSIREKEHLGYELGSFYQPLLYQSHIVGYVVTQQYRRNPKKEQPESVIDLVKAQLLEQYRQLAATGPTDAELARAKAYVLGRHALRQERSRDQAKWLAWNTAMGLGQDFDQYFATRVGTVTKEEVQAAAKRSLNNYALVVTVPEPTEPR